MTLVHGLDGGERWGVFETLVFVAWSDDHLAATEVASARAVAEELDLAGEPGAADARLRRGRRALADLDLESRSDAARSIVYATAFWMALADGVEHPAERATLRMLRLRLGLDEVRAALLEASARVVSASGDSAGPRVTYRALLGAVSDLVRADGGPFGRAREV